MGQFGYLGVALVINVIMARILSPAEFGQLGIVLFFIIIAKVLTEAGLSGALIRNNNATDVDYSTIFLFNLAVSIVLCLFLIVSSGYIADFYNDQTLKNLLITSSFILIINAFQLIQGAKLIKDMRFKQKAFYEFIAILISGTVGILLAVNNFGVWSLIVMQILTAFIITTLFWVFEGGIGTLIFDKNSFKYHYKFGVYTTLSSVLNVVFDNIYQVLLAKYFSIAQTGLYYQAKKIQELPASVINHLTRGVLFSGLSKKQDDKKIFKSTYQNIIRLFVVVSGFLSLSIFLFAKEIILLFIGIQWIEATFFLQTLTIVGFFYIQEVFNRTLFKIFNDTKYILYLELIKKVIQIVSIFIGLSLHRLDILMYGFVITSLFGYLINFYFTHKKYSFLGFTELITVGKITFINTLIIFFLVYVVKFDSDIINFLTRAFLMTILYLIGIYTFRLINFKEDLKLLKK